MPPVLPAPSGPATPPGVRSIARAVALLRAFSPDRPHLALGELAARARLDKGTARRILLTLSSLGLVVQDEATGRYALGLGVLELGAAVPRATDMRDVAAPVLQRLAQETQSTVFLSVYRDGEAMCVARFHGNQPVQVSWWQVGGTLPINCGAAPRVLLAFQRDAVIAQRLRRPFARLTPGSIVEPEALRAALARIRKRGWELATDDVAQGLAAVGVPVRGADGAVLAALSQGGLTPQIVSRGRPRFLAEVQAAAREIEAALA